MLKSFFRFVTALLAVLAWTSAALAAPPSRDDLDKERAAAIQAAFAAAVAGPSDVKLGEQGSIALPKGYAFFPAAEAARLMRSLGNQTGPSFLGIIVPTADGNWMSTVDFIPAGYVRDDDAKVWNAVDLLQSLRDGTNEGNKDRVARGFPELEVAGWVQEPAYDAGKHQLIWSALARDKGAAAGSPASVNYNTYALGREGFYKLNLITDSNAIEQYKSAAGQLIAALSFRQGKRYEDFDAKTDRVAEYGLAALIAGAAGKKLGLFAVIGAFLLKFWKLAALAVVAFGAGFSRLFKRSAQ